MGGKRLNNSQLTAKEAQHLAKRKRINNSQLTAKEAQHLAKRKRIKNGSGKTMRKP